jgi:TRAP-type uncharacterized transport system fused permease subunit
VVLATAGLAALAAACQGWLVRALAGWERAGLVAAGLLMVFPAVIEAMLDDLLPHPHLAGLVLGAALIAWQMRRMPGPGRAG